MEKKWWQKDGKGKPIAVATPVPGTAVAVGGPPDSSYAPPDASAVAVATPSAPYYMPAPNGPLHPKKTRHQQPPQTIGPMDAQIYKMQSMGQRTQNHKRLLMINIMAGFTGVNNAVAQCIALTYQGEMQMQIILRFYMIGFCILMVLNEMERTPIIRESLILTNWVSRGIFYTFLGVLGQDLYDVGYDNRYRRNSYGGSTSRNGSRSSDYNGYYGPRMPSSEDFAEWYIWMTSFVMFFVGLIYTIMGVLCLQQKLNQYREQYQQSQLEAAQQRGATSYMLPWRK